MMKYYCLTIVLFCIAHISTSQPWLENLPKNKSRQELTFFDYQQAFESYWAPFNVIEGYYMENGVKTKAPGWKQFKRWEYITQFRIDERTGAFPRKTALQTMKEYYQQHLPERDLPPSEWKSIGPFTSEGGFQGLGRTNCVAFHPTDLNTIWVGAASGGLWITKDGGNTWACLTDKNESLGINDIVITDDYETSQTIYIATGDRDSWDNNSIGVLKSTDGGITWNSTGLTFELADRKQVNRMLINPQNPNILIAATTDQVLRTSDGGTTWNEELTPTFFIDMEMHPANPDILYGSSFNGEVFRSINGGESWSRVLISPNSGRVEIAVTPADPDRLYVIAAAGGLKGIYRSDNSGETFEKVFDGATKNLLTWDAEGTASTGQGSYDLAIAASPVNANTLLIGGINTWRSTDGGYNWHLVSHWANGGVQVVHADKHSLRFRSNGDLWECNDGGVYASYDHGTTWHDKTNGMAISQMYRMGSSATERDEVVAGLQDNGTKWRSAHGWKVVNGGDGMECMIDPVDVNIQYTCSQSGNLFRTLDHYKTNIYIKPQAAGAGQWVTPYILDPNNPNILYGGFKEIWKSVDYGTSWNKVSSINASANINSMAVAPSNSNIVYVAEQGRMWRTLTGGEPFEKVYVFEINGLMTYLAVKHDDPETVWVTCGGYLSPGIYETKNGGEDWYSISQGLPRIPILCVAQNKQASEVELYVGTELGVFVKKGSADWVPFSEGLPNVIVTELEFYYSQDPTQTLLRASTYGRGMWETKVDFTTSPMQLVSNITTQPNTSSVIPGTTDAEILKIEILTTGDLEPLKATSFTFNTNGSTDATHDILNARLYYTSVNGFLTSEPFGEAVMKPNGTFTIEGEKELTSGPNYFWLVYDLSANAKLSNVIDAECTTFHIGSTITPQVVAPDGHRLIELIYCDAGATSLGGEYIRRVIIGNVDVTSMKVAGGYENHTDQVVEISLEKSVPVSVYNFSPHATDEVRIWADWNQDSDLLDPNELVYASGPLGLNIFTTSITPPIDAKLGLARLRIRLHDTAFGPNDTPCGNSNLGEVEDYVINVVDGTTSTEDGFQKEELRIHPNPFTGKVMIQTNKLQEEVLVQVYDPFGRPVFKGRMMDHFEVDLLGEPVGLYMITVGEERRLIVKVH